MKLRLRTVGALAAAAVLLAGTAAIALQVQARRHGSSNRNAATAKLPASAAPLSGSPDAQVGPIPTPLPVTPPAVPAPTPPPFASNWLAAHPAPELDLKGQAAILVDLERREVLWQRDPQSRRAPASLTKLMTAMVAADLAPLDQSVTATDSSDMAAVKKVEPLATVMGLSAGEVLSSRELLYGLFMQSGNDAAETLAGGIIQRDQFIDRMNQKAVALGMNGSHFSSPVGLDDPGMYSTAYDLAIAAAAIVYGYPELLAISGAPNLDIAETPAHKAHRLVNFNKLVRPGTQYTYAGATGMKTAFTDDAGPCVVETAQRAGRRLVVIVLHPSTDRIDDAFADSVKLFDYGFRLPS